MFDLTTIQLMNQVAAVSKTPNGPRRAIHPDNVRKMASVLVAFNMAIGQRVGFKTLARTLDSMLPNPVIEVGMK